MLMYKLAMFSVLLENMTKLIPRVLLIICYAVSVAFLISLFNNNGALSMKDSFYHPISTILYLYRYMKWWIANKDTLDFSETFWVITSFVTPYLSFITLKLILRNVTKVCRMWVKDKFPKLRNKHKKQQNNKELSSEQDLSRIKYQMMKAAEDRIDEHIKKLSDRSK